MPRPTAATTPLPACPVLTDAEATSRTRLLADLRAELASLGIRSILARNHRLVLRYNTVPGEPSGLTDPELHILGASADVATTDGSTYTLASGSTHPAADPAAAARTIAGRS